MLRYHRHRGQRGFSLIEMLVAAGMMGAVIYGVGFLFVNFVGGFKTMTARLALEAQLNLVQKLTTSEDFCEELNIMGTPMLGPAGSFPAVIASPSAIQQDRSGSGMKTVVQLGNYGDYTVDSIQFIQLDAPVGTSPRVARTQFRIQGKIRPGKFNESDFDVTIPMLAHVGQAPVEFNGCGRAYGIHNAEYTCVGFGGTWSWDWGGRCTL